MEGLGESGMLTTEGYEKYYSESLEKGLRYQDFVAAKLYERGIPLVSFQSRKYQKEHGENKAGIEIKFDDRMKSTGNVYIEIAEKANPVNPYYVASGIYRDDNSWLYVIGNYEVIYAVPKTTLKLLHTSARRQYKPVETPTSKGFLVPVCDAEKYAAFIVRIDPPTPNGG
jgi:hypothetical protein